MSNRRGAQINVQRALNELNAKPSFVELWRDFLGKPNDSISPERQQILASAFSLLLQILGMSKNEKASSSIYSILNAEQRLNAALYIAASLGVAASRMPDSEIGEEMAAFARRTRGARTTVAVEIISEERLAFYQRRSEHAVGTLSGNDLASRIADRINKRLAQARLPEMKINSIAKRLNALDVADGIVRDRPAKALRAEKSSDA